MRQELFVMVALATLIVACAPAEDLSGYDHVCSEEEQSAEACTMEYDPVCGSDGETYGNGCSACASGVDAWNSGEC